MSTQLSGEERRKYILHKISHSASPTSGKKLGELTGVSRQVIVQDIALLRSQGYSIIATARGYILDQPENRIRLFKVYHTDERTEEELNLIVDLGGTILDVMVNHRLYGLMSASLNIKNRRDVQHFFRNLENGTSTPLMKLTGGYHFHHIAADSNEILDEIRQALEEHGFLADVFPYEEEKFQDEL